MYQGTYWKVVLGGFLITVVLYVLSNCNGGQSIVLRHGQTYYHTSTPSETYKLNNTGDTNLSSAELRVYTTKRSNLSLLEVKLISVKVDIHDNQQPKLSSEVPNLSPEVSPDLPHQSPEISSGASDLSPKVSPEIPSISPEASPEPHKLSSEARNLSLQTSPKAANLSPDKQQPYLAPREVGYIKELQPDSPTTAPNNIIVDMYHHLLGIEKYEKHDKFDTQTSGKEYVNSLSSSQVKYMVTQMLGVNNLTSRKAQEQFIECAGTKILKELDLSQLNSSIPIPASHQHCKQMSFKSSGPIVALVSYPGSGNSWVRQLLELATGIYTGAVYCDSAYVKAGMIGEGVQTKNVLAIKLHQGPFDANRLVNNEKAIYIVRSPFGAILAENNRLVGKGSHTLEADYNYTSKAWKSRIKSQSRLWRSHVKKWLRFNSYPVLVVGYENLVKDTYTELKRMLDFIGYPYSEGDISCAVQNASETFHRSHTKKDVHPFPPELQDFILKKIKGVNPCLLKHNISLYHGYDKN